MSIKNERLLQWQRLTLQITNETLTDANETREEIEKRVRRLERDPEEWFRYYFPSFSYAKAADFHREATKRVLQHEEWMEVRIWSRELAKSTRTMMEVLFLVLAGHQAAENRKRSRKKLRKKRCVLLVSNSLENATRGLMPYRANLEFNKRLLQDYGEQKGSMMWTAGEFLTTGGVSFRAVGVGQSPRGTRNEEVRPDVLVFDDVDTDADCLNPELVAQKWRWIEEAAIGTRSVSAATTIIFCGNRISMDSCIQRATDIADHTEVVNIRDEAGRSVWAEKNREADIDRVLSQKSYAAQQKEYFNNPITEGAVFAELPYKPMPPMTEYELLVCYTDPSYTTTGDYKATVLVGKLGNEFHVIKCFVAKATTIEMLDWHYKIMDEVDGCTCVYLMEDVFMQDVLIKEVGESAARRGRSMPIIKDGRKKGNKFMRIESLLEPLLRNGELYFNEAERYNPHMKTLEQQFLAFGPGSRCNDDGPDAVEGAVWQLISRTKTASELKGIIYGARVNEKRF